MTSSTTDRGILAGGAGRRRAGFSLMEMVVVVGLVSLMAVIALPSIIALFDAGADSQAYNLLAAQLTFARALAIEKGRFAGVHVQLADARPQGQLLWPDQAEVCYSAVILYNARRKRFRVYGQVRRVPGSIVYGKLTEDTVSNSGEYEGESGDPRKFTTFTVVFSPQGSAVRSVYGAPVRFSLQDPAFGGLAVDPNAAMYVGPQQLWHMDPNSVTSYCQNQYAVTAITLFDMGGYAYWDQTARQWRMRGDWKTHLNENAQFLPLNVHTGQLYARE